MASSFTVSRPGCIVVSLIGVAVLLFVGWWLSFWVVLGIAVVGAVGVYGANRYLSKPERAKHHALNALNGGQFDLAEGFYGRLTQARSEPEQALAGYNGLIISSMLRGKFEAALGRLDQLERALGLTDQAPTEQTQAARAMLMARRGLCLVFMGRVEEASALYQETLRLTNYQSSEFMVLLGVIVSAREENYVRAFGILQQWKEEAARAPEQTESESQLWFVHTLLFVEMFVFWEATGGLPEETHDQVEAVRASIYRYPGISSAWPDAQVFIAMLRDPSSLIEVSEEDAERARGFRRAVKAMLDPSTVTKGKKNVGGQRKREGAPRKPKKKRSLGRKS